ncbi:MAG: glycyl-radical enzyme activating protein [Eubacteriales bacterium]|nr:glycyl-radical enzyme activating protein [Eubacteriales bacterium]
MTNTADKGVVFNIQRFSIHDGPGIRTTIFMKGCNLNCFWCHNPESISPKPQIQYFRQKCIGCRLCTICPNSAHIFREDHVYDRFLCTDCGKCAEVCYSEALVLTGKEYGVNELFNEIIKDEPFYTNGGGVTFSGGEPLLQAAVIASTAAMCNNAGISVVIDTAGCVKFEAFQAVIPYTSLFLYDIKHADKQFHKKYTGRDNDIIINNLRCLLENGADIWIRVPLIPDMNTNTDDIKAIAHLIAELQTSTGKKIKKFEFMPYHGTAEGKYISLGKRYQTAEKPIIDKNIITGYYSLVNTILDIESYTE